MGTGQVLGVLHPGQGFIELALDEQRLANHRGGRHPGSGQVAGLLFDGFPGQDQRPVAVAVVHGDLGPDGTEFAVHGPLGVLAHGGLQSGLGCGEPVLNLVELVLALGNPRPQQGQGRIIGNDVLRQRIQASLEQVELALGEKFAAV